MELAMMPLVRRRGPRPRPTVFVLATLTLLFAAATQAQTIQLSPAQQQMLEQLPPAQRQQAMDAIRQFESQQAEGEQQTINESLEQAAPTIDSTDLDELLESDEKTAQGRSRLVVNFTPIEMLTASERLELDEDPLLQKLIGSHLFVLDRSGVLSLQGLQLIPLLGLNEDDINRRLAAEPFLSFF
jgi:hypothetical protein